jgi:hypothetical protein
MSRTLTEETIRRDITETTQRLDALKLQMASLTRSIEDETRYLAKLREFVADDREAPTSAEPEPKQPSPKIDKRSLWNPIKNLNIGVVRSYEWQKRHGYNAREARQRVYRSITATAIKRKVESDHSTTENVLYVGSAHDLPKKVVEKIEYYYSLYKVTPPEKTRRLDVPKHAESNVRAANA